MALGEAYNIEMRDFTALQALLQRLDGDGYRAYSALQGEWLQAGDIPLRLCVDHVQGDPFAAPSRLRVQLAQKVAGFPPSTFATEPRRRALCSWLACRFSRAADNLAHRAGSGRSGLIDIDRPGQQLLHRTCLLIDDDGVEARFVVGLPAAGRRILGEAAVELLCERVPDIVAQALKYDPAQMPEIDAWTQTAEDADALRQQLRERDLVAFVADDSVLPRFSGIDDGPMLDGVTSFAAPPSLRVELQAPNAGTITGLGIPRGVTLVVGGGYHGKSTLLEALALGVYDHRPGDGRERVVTDDSAVTIRAENGRRTAGVDVSSFIGELPSARDTRAFCSDDASGSTSQAANIVEAVEAGARLLLVDEDLSATNFMIRDGRMQQLVASEDEPITPFVDRVRSLYDDHGVSTILVMGGSGDYFEVADTVIAMESYQPRDVTDRAHEIAAADRGPGSLRRTETCGDLTVDAVRAPHPDSIDPRRGRRAVSWRVRDRWQLQVGESDIDLHAVSQLVDASQTRAIAGAILLARQHMDGRRLLPDILDLVEHTLAEEGLDALSPHPVGDLAACRRHELAAALNRLRTLRVCRPDSPELELAS
ncbi:MAG TPA: ABC-ATPase domain-containing protein [Candidatus Latescibacteria bacterium]|jgi:predicted ABC-class ATPase|nr:ABC-ATPase domain-containing protein [Candidatus Latescibacterota bacterium]HJP33296.1 ABC-ATPase domain-containing protein [Candidatus Latescibacterota bacterium]